MFKFKCGVYECPNVSMVFGKYCPAHQSLEERDRNQELSERERFDASKPVAVTALNITSGMTKTTWTPNECVVVKTEHGAVFRYPEVAGVQFAARGPDIRKGDR